MDACPIDLEGPDQAGKGQEQRAQTEHQQL
jgi:hypothetical protein